MLSIILKVILVYLGIGALVVAYGITREEILIKNHKHEGTSIVDTFIIFSIGVCNDSFEDFISMSSTEKRIAFAIQILVTLFTYPYKIKIHKDFTKILNEISAEEIAE